MFCERDDDCKFEWLLQKGELIYDSQKFFCLDDEHKNSYSCNLVL